MKILLTVITVVFLVLGILWLRKGPVGSTELLESLQSDYNSGNLDGLIERANAALKVNQDDIDALIALATTYAMKGSVGYSEAENGKKAIEYSDRVIAIDPNNSEAFRIKGYAYEIQELYPEAHQNYEKAIDNNPRNFQAWSNKGHAYDLQGDQNKAEEYYKKSLEINPTGEHALLNLARLLIRQRKAEEAKAQISTLVTSTTSLRYKSEANQILAEIYRSAGDYTAALEAIEKSISSDNTVPQAWVTRGRIELRSTIGVVEADIRAAKLNASEEFANKALAINKNQATAYLLLADIMTMKGNQQKRQEYREQGLRAIDVDITLGQSEKSALRKYLTTKITLVSPQSSARE